MKGHAILFVHGAFHGPWCWEKVVERLQSPAVTCRAVDLDRGGLEPDTAAVREEVDALCADGRSVVVVGHSLGCTSLGHLEPDGVAHAVFLAGPVTGAAPVDVSRAIEPRFMEALEAAEGRAMRIQPELARAFFYHDCEGPLADWAVGNLRPNLLYGPGERTGPPLHEQVPSTYLWCDDDRVVLPAYQREVAAEMSYREGFATSHSPMLSAPDELSAALRRVLERTPLAS